MRPRSDRTARSRVAGKLSTGAVLVSSGKDGRHEAIGRAEIEKARARGFAVDPTFFAQTDVARGIFGDFPATAGRYLDRAAGHKLACVIFGNDELACALQRDNAENEFS